MERLLNKGITIVFGENTKYKAKLIDDFKKQNYQYITPINNYLSDYKYIGPIRMKNTKSILGILKSDFIVGKSGEEYIISQINAVDCDMYIDRYTLQLTTAQKKRVSLIKDVYEGNKHFIFDDSFDENKSFYLDMISYIRQSKEFEGGSAIWFTHFDIMDILKELGG